MQEFDPIGKKSAFNLEGMVFGTERVLKKEESFVKCDYLGCREYGNYIRCYFLYESCSIYKGKT